MELTEDAKKLLKLRYCRGNEQPEDVYPRVAKALGKHNGNEKEFLKIMEENRFLPNSPTLRNAGYENVNKACFTLPIEDSMDSIFKTLRDAALIFKCISVNQNILTPIGIKKAKNLEVGEFIFDSNGNKQKILDIIASGKKEIYRLTTTAGYEIECSEEHKILCLSDVGWHGLKKATTIKFKKLKDLKYIPFGLHKHRIVGDHICISYPTYDGIYQEHKYIQEHPKDINDGRFKIREIILPEILTSDLSWLLGFFTGDGSYHRDGIRFCINSQIFSDLEKEVDRIALSLGILTSKSGSPRKKEIGLLRKNLYNFFKFLLGDNKYHIPRIIFESPISVRAAYLRGLFDADGFVSTKGYISYCTAREEYAEEIRALLLSVGILTKFSKHSSKHFNITINNKDSHEKFICLINSSSSFKSNRMAIIPKFKRDYIKYDGKYFDKISKIEKIGIEDTINFTIENTHEYCSIGIVSKNSGGGVGYNFSNLRQKDAPLSAGGTSSGMMSFLNVFDAITEAIKQGGFRRGASIGILEPDHPEIIEFVKAKIIPNKLTNFNLSVLVNNDFMNRIETGEYTYFRDRLDKRKITGKIKTNELFSLIAFCAWLSGDPGLLFYDRINQDNPEYPKHPIIACNPCSEQPLFPYESCCLGSINLNNHIENDDINYDKLKESIQIGTKFLLAINKYSEYPVESCYKLAYKTQRIGLGLMGWSDSLLKLHIIYDSTEALQLIDKIGKMMYDEAKKIAYNSYSVLSIAPTGSLSILANCSPSIEPIFSKESERRVVAGTFKESYEDSEYLRLAHDISPEWHIKVQAQWQKWIDSGVSKTINMHHDSTIQDIQDAYKLAFKLGCKGITIYRDRSKDTQVYYNTTPKCEGDVCYL